MKKEINYKVNGKEWEDAQNKAFQKLNSKAEIDGFRPGRAPRKVFEKKYGSEQIINQAADQLLQKQISKIISDDELKPAIEPKVEIVKMDRDGFEVKFTIIVDSEVTLGEYKNLDVKKEEVKVTEKEIDEKIQFLLRDYAELVVKDGKVEKGDIAIINFEGTKDGVAFEGGKGENYSLEIGSNTFIPGFEDGVIGMKLGEEKDIDLTFPDDYGVEDLNGAKVVFKVKVNEIKQRVVPTLDKEFFEDLGMKGITTEEQLRKQMKDEIKENKEQAAEHKYIDDVLEKASANMKVEIDDELVLAEALRMYDEFMKKMSMQGLTEEVYLNYANTTKDDIVSHMKEEALRRVKNRYLLEAIVKAEKIEVSDEELKNGIADMAKKYEMIEQNVVSAVGGEEALRYDMKMRKAIRVITGENK